MSIFIDELRELIKSADDETLKTLALILDEELKIRNITEEAIYPGI